MSLFEKLILQLVSMRWTFNVYNCSTIMDTDIISNFIEEEKIGKDLMFITFVMGNEEPIVFEQEEEKIKELLEYLKEW